MPSQEKDVKMFDRTMAATSKLEAALCYRKVVQYALMAKGIFVADVIGAMIFHKRMDVVLLLVDHYATQRYYVATDTRHGRKTHFDIETEKFKLLCVAVDQAQDQRDAKALELILQVTCDMLENRLRQRGSLAPERHLINHRYFTEALHYQRTKELELVAMKTIKLNL